MGLLKKIFLFQITVLGLLFIPDAQAQVTIGNADEPIMGSLLDLKKNVDNENNVTADKGLGLSRVMLTNKSELYPMFDSLNLPVDYADQKNTHKGLTVWNVNEMFGKGVGTYVWNGTDWVNAHPALHDNFDYTETTVRKRKINRAERDPYLYLPNCYMVHPSAENKSCTFTFPVRKAYAIWENYKTPPLSQPFPNKKIVSGRCKAKLIWQDRLGLVDRVEISSDSVDYDATITVLFNEFPTSGNASIALTIDGIVHWTWHLWYTPYRPNAIPEPNKGYYGEYSHYDAGGSVFYYNNGTPGGDYIFMDRNLGANATSTNIDESLGFLYQWGRKDPFPSSIQRIYDMSGNIIYTRSKNYPPMDGYFNIASLPSTSDGEFNLLNTIYYPLNFYFNRSDYATWYTNRKRLNPSQDTNFDLWNESGRKGPFDPCPQGWRVPVMTNRRPWFNQNASFTSNYNDNFKIADIGGDLITSQNQRYLGAFSFENVPDYNIGSYPVGRYIEATGDEVRGTSLYWCIDPYQLSIYDTSYLTYIPGFELDLNKGSVYLSTRYHPMSTGASIRCVKDTNE